MVSYFKYVDFNINMGEFMLKTKYNFLKRLYPVDVILFYKDGKYLLYGNDRYITVIINDYFIVDKCEKNHINYLIIDNLTIIKRIIYDNNRFYEYLFKGLLIDVLDNKKEVGIYEK